MHVVVKQNLDHLETSQFSQAVGCSGSMGCDTDTGVHQVLLAQNCPVSIHYTWVENNLLGLCSEVLGLWCHNDIGMVFSWRGGNRSSGSSGLQVPLHPPAPVHIRADSGMSLGTHKSPKRAPRGSPLLWRGLHIIYFHSHSFPLVLADK